MEYIIKLILSLPLFWKIVLTSILVISNIAYLFRKQLFKKPFLNNFKSEKKVILSTVDKLKEHKLFTEKSFLLHKIKRINVGGEKKSNVFQKLLIIKYNTIIKNAKLLIENQDIYDLSNKQFYAFVIKNMTTIVEEYNDKIKFEFGEDIYNLIMMHVEKGFNNIHEKTIVFIKNTVEETFESDHVVYSTSEDKIDFLLDLYYIAMKIAMTDVDKVYKNFNGDLDKLLKKCKNC